MELEFSTLLKDLPKEYKKETKQHYKVAENTEEIKNYISNCKEFSVDLETTSLDPLEAEIVGISLSTEEGTGIYIPVAHKDGKNIPIKEVFQLLNPYLTSKEVLKIGQNLKYEIEVIAKHGLGLELPIFDTMVASYLINPLKKRP